MEPIQKPSVGRIVHYQSHGSPNGQHKSESRAAIITAVRGDIGNDTSAGPGIDGYADLCVLNPTGMHFDRATPFAETPTAGCWNWPPRV